MLRPRLSNEYGNLMGGFPEPNQSRSINRWVRIENSLARQREHGSVGGLQTMRLSPAKPKSIVFIQVTKIPHSMPESAGRIHDLMQGVGIRPGDVFGGHDRPFDNQLSNRARRDWVGVFKSDQRSIIDFNHPPLDSVKSPPYACPRPLATRRLGLLENFCR